MSVMGDKLKNVPNWVWWIGVVALNCVQLYLQKNFVTRVEFNTELATRTNYVTRVEYDARHQKLEGAVEQVHNAVTALDHSVLTAMLQNNEHQGFKDELKTLSDRLRMVEIYCGPPTKAKP